MSRHFRITLYLFVLSFQEIDKTFPFYSLFICSVISSNWGDISLLLFIYLFCHFKLLRRHLPFTLYLFVLSFQVIEETFQYYSLSFCIFHFELLSHFPFTLYLFVLSFRVIDETFPCYSLCICSVISSKWGDISLLLFIYLFCRCK